MKTCFKCKIEKPLTEYYKHGQMKDGRLNKCKDCTKKDVSIRYSKNPEKLKSYELSRASLPHRIAARKAYSLTIKGRERGGAAKSKWAENNRIKRGANQIVGNAVRDGKLSKPTTCESCHSAPKRLHGHHDDYAHPLSVRWLCPGCHNKWHKENGQGLNGI